MLLVIPALIPEHALLKVTVSVSIKQIEIKIIFKSKHTNPHPGPFTDSGPLAGCANVSSTARGAAAVQQQS
jgi:hypothetical protein